MLTFQIVGFIGLALFLSAMVSGRSASPAR
jgi:hypothetical protein